MGPSGPRDFCRGLLDGVANCARKGLISKHLELETCLRQFLRQLPL